VPVGSEKRKSVTINDIALAVGVGKATVSLSLNGRGNISAATRHRILHTARQLGYSPNGHAQSLSRGHNKLVGLLSVAMFPGVHTRTVEVIQNMVTRRGYDVPQYGFGLRGASDPDYQMQLLDSLRSQRPRAIICHFTPHIQHPAVVEALTDYQDKGGILVCYGDNPAMPCDFVGIDYDDLTYQAARHLLSLGHRKIGLFVAGLNLPAETRPDAFRRALEEHGTEPRDEWMFDGSSWDAGGAEAAKAFTRLEERPSGMVIANDLGAGTFINGVVRAGLRVPEDVSVVGNFDEPFSRYWLPPITTVAYPVDQVANIVTDMLCTRLDGQCAVEPRNTTVRGELIVRESAAAHFNLD